MFVALRRLIRRQKFRKPDLCRVQKVDRGLELPRTQRLMEIQFILAGGNTEVFQLVFADLPR